jgi:hypothetical protein
MVNANSDRQAWVPMTVERLGSVAELLQQGGGKLSLAGGDPGEPRKQKPIG